MPAIQVRAASITVNSSCSLADAITSANSDSNSHNTNCTAGSGDDTITLTANITLSAALPNITSNITIEGENKTISGNNQFRIFRINNGAVSINNLTLRNGRADDIGTNEVFGGAIYTHYGTSTTLTVSRSNFIDNVAPEPVTSTSCGIAYGGAIAAFGESLTIEDSVFRGNRAPNGAAVIAGTDDAMIIRRSSFTGHRIPADAHDECQTYAGGVMRFQGSGSILSNVTISGNFMTGVRVTKGTTTIRHSTIVNNRSASENFGGGLVQFDPDNNRAARVNLYNSIIANNRPHNCEGSRDVSIWLTASVNNLEQPRIVENAQGEREEVTDCNPTYTGDPKLASFRGSPGYRPLIEGSPAIDAGDATQCANLPLVNGQRVDIRGVARSDGACDLGSYEGFLALPRSGGGGGGGGEEEASTKPDGMPGTVCADCPDLLAQGYRLKAHNGLDSGVQFRRVGAGAIGDQSLLRSGFIDAIDVYGWAEQGVGVCFPGAGSLLFLDAAFSPRAVVPLSGYTQDGMTCADFDRPGTVLLLAGAAPAAQGALSMGPARGLQNCMVTTDAILNFRRSPGGPQLHFVDPWGDEIAGWLPRGVTLTALERTADWFRVDYHGTRGWVSAEWVTAQGNCA